MHNILSNYNECASPFQLLRTVKNVCPRGNNLFFPFLFAFSQSILILITQLFSRVTQQLNKDGTMFTNRKRHQKDARDASQETASSSVVSDDARLSEMSDAELEERTKQILKEMNIKQIDNAMETMDKTKMMQLCYHYRQQKMSEESAAEYCHRIKKSLERKEDWKKLLESLSITMSNKNVPWINEFGEEGGFHLLTSLLGKLLNQLDHIRSKSAAAFDSEDTTTPIQEEEYCISCLLDAIKATRSFLNCQSGIHFLFRPGSRLCFKLIEMLFMSSSVSADRFRRFQYGQIMLGTLPLLFTLPFIPNGDSSDHINDAISGRDLLSRELTAFADQRNVPRFACVVNCFRFDDPKITDKALCFLNSFLSTTNHENEWRVRVLWRGEFIEAGLKPLIPKIQCLVEKNEKLEKTFCQFEQAQVKDTERLKECFNNLQNDVNDLDSCANMLLSSCKDSDCEHILLQLLLKLLLVSDRKYKRSTYFSIINKCVSSVAFGDAVLGPETEKQHIFNGDLDEEFDRMERDDGIKRLNKRLDSAVEEKQEAVSLQVKYYEKIKEYQHECDELRKLVKSGTTAGQALPAPTVLDLPQPKEFASGASKHHGSAATTAAAAHPTGPGCPPPPPPPPPPPALLMPEHKRNNLTTTTTAGAAGTGPPQPPPPPPPSALRSGGGGPPMPPPPPPLAGFGGTAALLASPELPDFLRKKCSNQPEMPMKKIPWNAIRPSAIKKESLWAQIDEKELASDDLFDFLKAKFSATGKMNCLPLNMAKRPPSKAKTPLVIQDAKMLQALAILQGSCKLSFKRWRAAILEVDEKALNAELVDKLKSALPPLDMINRLKKCTEDEMQRMPEGEQFVATLSSINGLPIRLEAIHLKLCWSEAFGELKSGLTTVTEACEELLKSQGFRHFINLVLLVGNFMGRTKNSKDAFAFELSVLNRLVDTRDCDNSETLLHGLIRLLHWKFNGKFTTFALDDFHHVSKACRVDVSELSKAKIDQVRSSIAKVDKYLSSYKSQADNDHFNEKIGAFVEQAKQDLITVDSLWENMERKWERVQAYLCFDPKKYPMDRLFADVHAFKGHYQNARTEVLKDQLKASDADAKEGAAQKTSRKPFKPIQPTIATEAAKKAQERNNSNRKELHLLSADGIASRGIGGGGGGATPSSMLLRPSPAAASASTVTPTRPNALGTDVAGGDGGVIDKIEQMLEEGKYRMECQKRPYRVRRKGQPTVYVSSASTAATGDSLKNPMDTAAVEEREEEETLKKKSVVNELLSLPSSVDLLRRLRGLD